ncbi:hypothetical protein AX16_003474 [Volvariella volvacea WC 439]|nr:hypothetical protein AX16_003474 [Volvariella volvacea WC 439]
MLISEELEAKIERLEDELKDEKTRRLQLEIENVQLVLEVSSLKAQVGLHNLRSELQAHLLQGNSSSGREPGDDMTRLLKQESLTSRPEIPASSQSTSRFSWESPQHPSTSTSGLKRVAQSTLEVTNVNPTSEPDMPAQKKRRVDASLAHSATRAPNGTIYPYPSPAESSSAIHTRNSYNASTLEGVVDPWADGDDEMPSATTPSRPTPMNPSNLSPHARINTLADFNQYVQSASLDYRLSSKPIPTIFDRQFLFQAYDVHKIKFWSRIICPITKSTRHIYCATPELNPFIPKISGKPGILYTGTNSKIQAERDDSWQPEPFWRNEKVSLVVRDFPQRWRYVGEYMRRLEAPMTPKQFSSLRLEVCGKSSFRSAVLARYGVG